jgi:histidinol-phosphatase (PHP family)
MKWTKEDRSMQSNFHSHCLFCDGSASIETFIKFAIAKNLKQYGISSHSPVPLQNDWSMRKEDIDEYRQEILRLKEKYKPEIEVYLGLEVDFILGISGANDEFIQSRKWDYLISSIHHLEQFPDRSCWNIDEGFDLFKEGLKYIFSGNIALVAKTFYRRTCEMIELGGFDMIGHMDKISFNGRRIPGFDISDKWYDDLIQETFRLLAEKEIIVEINTKLFYEKGVTFPDIRYFKQLHQLGIPIMVNSDCHCPDKITNGFAEVYKLLQEAGFKTVRILKEGKWNDVPIMIK